MQLLMDLPYNVLDDIISFTDKHDWNNLSSVSRIFRYKVDQYIYKHIMIIDSENIKSKDFTVLPVARLPLFAKCLNSFTFQFIDKIVIHSQSNFNSYNYQILYDTLSNLWDPESENHKLRLFNFDINNLRAFQSFNHHLNSMSIEYIENEDEDSCELTQKNHKVNNLKNWIIFDVNEFCMLSYNPNLEDLDLCIERPLYATTSRPLTQLLTRAVYSNLANVTNLYLNLPMSISFLKDVYHIRQFQFLKIEKLSLTSSHCFRHEPCYFEDLNRFINFNQLKELELKVNCTLTHCTENCLPKFFQDWFTYNNLHRCLINLNKLVVINYKSNNSVSNLNQFNTIIENYIFNANFESVEEITININDFTKLDLGRPRTNGNIFNTLQQTNSNIKNIFNGFSNLPLLKNLVISDFFYKWLKDLPQLVNSPLNYFDFLVNQCNCSDCNETRFVFKELARSGHNQTFSLVKPLKSYPIPTTTKINIDDKANLQYLNFIISQLKHEFIYLNQNLFSVNSLLNTNDKPLMFNDDVLVFNKLFLHSCLFDIVQLMKTTLPSLNTINLGGIFIEFDKENKIKPPYNVYSS